VETSFREKLAVVDEGGSEDQAETADIPGEAIILTEPKAEIRPVAASNRAKHATTASAPPRRGVRIPAKTIRLRDKEHRKFVAMQPCLVCGRTPADPHHLRFAQPRAMSRKVSDEFTVPVCRLHHRELHTHGDEKLWWKRINIDPLPIALRLWKQGRNRSHHPFPVETPVSQQVWQPGQMIDAPSPKSPNPADQGNAPVTSFRQIEANRRNATRSTGPITEAGKASLAAKRCPAWAMRRNRCRNARRCRGLPRI
jgi:hypothetical protein